MSPEHPDRIVLKGVACRVRLGVTGAERRKAQKVLIDLTLEADLRPAGRSDDLQDSVDYWEVEKRVRGLAESGSFKLAERLADAAARAVLASDARIRSVCVAVHKRPSVMRKTREVVVEISRSR